MNNKLFAGRFIIEESEWEFFKKAVKHHGYNTASEVLRERVREINEKERQRLSQKEIIVDILNTCPFCNTHSLKERLYKGLSGRSKTDVRRMYCTRCYKILYTYDILLDKWIKNNCD